ncbi:MAG TPA: hypothetical protein GX010_01455 [Erysipelotrichaceae bacterium]|nr:hypothetical protein [Erysipelotrichaceae bacterium]
MKKLAKILCSIGLAVIPTVLSSCGTSVPSNFRKKEVNMEVSQEFSLAEYNENPALKNYPILVGGMAHGKEFINAFHDLELGNMVWIPKKGYALGNTDWQKENYGTDAEAAAAKGMYYMASHARGLGTEFKKGGYGSGGDTHVPTPSKPEEIQKVISAGEDKDGNNLFFGWHAEELDGDFVQNGRLAFGARIPDVYDFTDEAGARVCYEKELKRINQVAYDMGGDLISNQLVTHQLNGFRAGNDIIIDEFLEHGPNIELKLGYLRGGRNMFGTNFGIWVSPWYLGQVPAADTKLFPNSYASLTGGHKTASYRHCIYEAYVSGAKIITNQETEPLIARDVINGGYREVLWGKELKNFWSYVKNHAYDDVVGCNETAIMVDRDNGWEVGRLWGGWYLEDSNWGKLAQTTANKMLSNYLNVFSPGYGRTIQQISTRTDLYPGYFAQSPLGAYDVIATDIAPERLAKYKNVIVLGDIKMNDILNQTLKSFVSGGGNLMISAYQSMSHGGFYEDPEFYGFIFQDFDGWNYSDRVVFSNTIKKVPSSEDKSLSYVKDTYTSNQFVSVIGVQSTAEALATESGKNMPIFVKNNYGKGKVFLALTEWCLDQGNNMLDFYADAIRSIILNSNPTIFVSQAKTDGTNNFSYQTSIRTAPDGKKQLLILVSSYDINDGKVTVQFDPYMDVDVDDIHIEVCGGEGYDTFTSNIDNGLSLTLSVKAEDLALIVVDNI